MAVLGGLRGLAGHGEGREGVALFGVLLGIAVLGSRGTLGCHGAAFSSINSRCGRFVPFYELLGCGVKLQSDKNTQDQLVRQDALGFIFNGCSIKNQ